MDGKRQLQSWVRPLACCLGLIHLAACGGSSSATTSVPPASGAIQQPTAINLYPATSSAEGARLFVLVTAVGSTAVRMPLAFDTGSAGITLYAPDIFPASMVTAGGFVFSPGQTSLTYNGITVTDQSGKRKYGSIKAGRTQTGNIGFAQVTFGDEKGQLITQTMPVFLYYLITDNLTGQAEQPPPLRGWFGVNAAPNLIAVTGSSEPASGYPACAPATPGSCYVVSILKYLSYAAGVRAGFMLAPAPLQACDITVPGSCAPSAMLTVGVNDSIQAGFSMSPLNCPPSNYSGPEMIVGYTVCDAGVPNSTIAVSGASSGMLTGTVLFDSGTPATVMRVPARAPFPGAVPSGTSVMVGMPSGFDYSYTAGAATDVTATLVQSNSSLDSIVGIGFFTTNSFLVDFTSGTEGWK
jgi:hypothetical protein